MTSSSKPPMTLLRGRVDMVLHSAPFTPWPTIHRFILHTNSVFCKFVGIGTSLQGSKGRKTCGMQSYDPKVRVYSSALCTAAAARKNVNFIQDAVLRVALISDHIHSFVRSFTHSVETTCTRQAYADVWLKEKGSLRLRHHMEP
eukprot:265440-Amphidinium_carterae.2